MKIKYFLHKLYTPLFKERGMETFLTKNGTGMEPFFDQEHQERNKTGRTILRLIEHQERNGMEQNENGTIGKKGTRTERSS